MARFGRGFVHHKNPTAYALYPQSASGNVAAVVTLGITPLVDVPATGNIAGNVVIGFSPEAIGPGASGVPLVATTTLGLSPEGIGEKMGIIAAVTLAFSPEGIGPGAGGMPLIVSVVESGTVALKLPNAPLTANVTLAFSPEGVGAPGNIAATVTLTFSPEGIGEAMGLIAAALLGFSPEEIGVPGPLAVTVTLSAAASLGIQSANLLVAVVCAVISGLIHLSYPSHQSGYQYVRDIPSTPLPNNCRQYVGVGVPSANLGNNGDLYRRSDGVIGTNSLYARASGSWSAIN